MVRIMWTPGRQYVTLKLYRLQNLWNHILPLWAFNHTHAVPLNLSVSLSLTRRTLRTLRSLNMLSMSPCTVLKGRLPT